MRPCLYNTKNSKRCFRHIGCISRQQRKSQSLYFAGRLLDKTSPYLIPLSLDSYLGAVGCAKDVAEGYHITHMAAGHDFALIAYRTLSPDLPRERVFAIGNNTVGQLGLGYNSHEMTRGMVDLSEFSEPSIGNKESSFDDHPENRRAQILQLAAGRESAFLLLQRQSGKSELLTWGGSAFGSSGLGISTHSLNGEGQSKQMMSLQNVGRQIPVTPRPRLVSLQAKVTGVHAGLDHTICRTVDGLFSAGWNADGQLGRVTPVPHESATFGKITLPFPHEHIKSISTSADHTLVLLNNGMIYSWGNSEYGQCMTSKSDHRQAKPTAVSLSLPDGRRAVSAKAAGSYSLILDHQGTAYICGHPNFGTPLEDPGVSHLLRPLEPQGITALEAHVHNAVLIDEDKKIIYVMGTNSRDGLLGLGPSPPRLLNPPTALQPKSLASVLAAKAEAFNRIQVAIGGECMLVMLQGG